MLGRYLGFHLCKSITHSHACVAACTVFWNWDVTLFLADLIRQVETERTYLEQQSGDRRRLTEYIRRCHLHRAVRSSLSSSFITIHVIYYCSLTNVNNYNNNNNCFLAETKPCLSEWGAVALISVVAGTLVRCMHAALQHHTFALQWQLWPQICPHSASAVHLLAAMMQCTVFRKQDFSHISFSHSVLVKCRSTFLLLFFLAFYLFRHSTFVSVMWFWVLSVEHVTLIMCLPELLLLVSDKVVP